MTDRAPEHDQLNERMDEVLTELHVVREQATAAHEEARGAHTQAKRTNGRVDRLDRAVFGRADGTLDDDGGLVGWTRQTRRDIRIVGALVVFVMPVVLFIMDRVIL